MDWAERMPEADRLRLEPKRFCVSFETRLGQQVRYYVCTCLDARKALVIAAGYHKGAHPALDQSIYEVVGVTRVDGDRLYNSDLCDRAEW